MREYPENPPDDWFFEFEDQRVFACDWGWYVMDISNASWRDYWAGEVLRQLRANSADGVFVDGLFPPNYLGGEKFKPNLPALDRDFEDTWSSKIEDFIAFGQGGELQDYFYIVNVGEWVTSRDQTDYSGADGIMVEGFGRWTTGEYFLSQSGDWQLQMDRILGMVNQDKIVVLQQYVGNDDVDDRLFLLGNYLLVKGRHTYLNLEFSAEPEWFPEYEIPIGSPDGETPLSISSLWHADWGVYVRKYSNSLVLVNPHESVQEVAFQKSYYQVFPVGGGIVPADGDVSEWTLDYVPVRDVSVKPNQAVILLDAVSE